MSIALTAFYAGAVAYDHANHALTWAHTHVPLLAGLAALTGFAAGLLLRRTTADQRAWQDSTSGDDVPAADDNQAGTNRGDLRTCWAQWPDAPTWNDTRKEHRKP